MKYFFLKSAIFYISAYAFIIFQGCSSVNKESSDMAEAETKRSVFIIGEVSWKDWMENAHWEDYSAPGFNPEDSKVEAINIKLQDGSLSFLLVGGDWCGDSKEQMPIIYKLFELARYDIDMIKLYGVDMNKNEPGNICKRYDIERIPTLIIFRNESEIGRITETPAKSWEDDILEILNK